MAKTISPKSVHEVLQRRILLSGMPVVLDLDRSHGNWLYDARSEREYLDMFTFYASRALSYDHPAIADQSFREELARVAVHKPSNCDIYTAEYAAFVDRMATGCAADFPHLFVVSGGALAVENALKCAFDWKVRKNLAAGRGERGHRVVHFRHAFHGRSGYTLSLTDSPDPRKTQYYPLFDWPRVETPVSTYPLTGERLAALEAAEARSLAAVAAALTEREHDVAAIIVEPIQGEGGDNHFRPAFLAGLRALADAHEALLIFDEVQTGMGLTGAWWAHERLGMAPDLVVFGKKFQVCGFLASSRIDDVDNVFRVPSRISSTFEGNLVDMVRCTRILEVVAEDGLIEHAAAEGEWLLGRVRALADARPDQVSNPRGLGLMVAFDLPDTAARNAVRERCFAEGLIILGCGPRSIRFRPSLDVRREELEEALVRVERALG